MTQKEAVHMAVTSILASAGINFTSGVTVAAGVLDKNLRSQVNAILIQQFLNKEIDLSDEARTRLSNTKNLRSYVSQLVSNWLKKDSRLNGGAGQVPAPKAKKNVNDPQLKAMRHLLTVQTDASKRNEIQSFIDQREQELSS